AIATLFTDEGYPAGPSDIVARLERFANDDAQGIGAEHDGAVLRFIAFCALPRFEHDDWIVRIVALVVDAGARERGVGRTLLAEAARAAAERGGAARACRRRTGPPRSSGRRSSRSPRVITGRTPAISTSRSAMTRP